MDGEPGVVFVPPVGPVVEDEVDPVSVAVEVVIVGSVVVDVDVDVVIVGSVDVEVDVDVVIVGSVVVEVDVVDVGSVVVEVDVVDVGSVVVEVDVVDVVDVVGVGVWHGDTQNTFDLVSLPLESFVLIVTFTW